ncbi:replicative DNA helicase [Chitinophaga sp. YIM B06452]|uniref:replicative DNA helicase n=1 Tax=Chitinophaga sp. YIM B06452 TaxID=3082158 RepID=UPI0031FED8C5
MQHQVKKTTNTGNGDRNRKHGRGADRRNDVSTMVYGKVPPQEKDLEEAVLGAVMLEKGAFDLVGGFMKPEFFYYDAHQRIYTAMHRVNEKNQPVDILTVVQDLKQAGELELVGGPFAVTRLSNNVVSSANIEAHARIIQQKFIARELIRISGEIISRAYEDTTDVFDLLDQAETGLFSISSGHLKNDFSKIDDLYRNETAELERRMQKREDITGVPSGFKALDSITGGWQPEDLIIIAARPSMGKTAFALNLARNAATNERKPTGVGIFSLEMSKGQVTQRLVSAESAIELHKIRRGKMSQEDLQQLHRRCVHSIAMAPIYIDDTGALNIYELRAKARRMVERHGVGLIIIDYLQLMSGLVEGRNSNREQEISRISRELKGLAKSLKVPVIALSQLSREVEKRKDGRPQLSDLRESGAIEQDADIVMFLSRSDYQKAGHEIDPELQGNAEVIMRKHRNGELDDIALKANLALQLFTDIPSGMDIAMAENRFIPRKEAEAKFARPVPLPAENTLDTTEPDEELPF